MWKSTIIVTEEADHISNNKTHEGFCVSSQISLLFWPAQCAHVCLRNYSWFMAEATLAKRNPPPFSSSFHSWIDLEWHVFDADRPTWDGNIQTQFRNSKCIYENYYISMQACPKCIFFRDGAVHTKRRPATQSRMHIFRIMYHHMILLLILKGDLVPGHTGCFVALMKIQPWITQSPPELT